MKPKILYFSDCVFFAGCENMIANFLNDENITSNFEVFFAYNYSETYSIGLNSRVKNLNFTQIKLKLLKQKTLKKSTNNKDNTLINLYLMIYHVVYKYLSIVVNTFILFFFLKKNKFDILHINNGGYPAANSCYSAVFAGKMSGIKNIIYVVNNIAESYKKPTRWLDFPLDLLVVSFVKYFITGSEYAGKQLLKILRIKNEKYLTINNGIDRRSVILSRDEFRNSYNIKKSAFVFSTIANLEKRKGHFFLLEAISRLRSELNKDEFSKILFVIEGDGHEKDYILDYIKKNELDEFILMFDFLPNIFDLINASDVIILPSISNEDFPNIILEAMSLGKPVIATDIAGIPEQIINNTTGLVVNNSDSLSLKNAILYMNNNPEKVIDFSKESILRFDNYFTKNISVNKYFNLYLNLIK